MTPRGIDLQDRNILIPAFRDLRGFWKLWSGVLLSSCGLPTLRGILVTGSYPKMSADVRQFLGTIGSHVALVRHDRRPELPPHPRGGFLVGEALLGEVIRFFFDLGRIVAVYEPSDPLLNMYNINFLFESERDVYAEVVGPGFDASDLQRGDLSPHERFSIRAGFDGEISQLKLLSRVDQEAFQESVIQRKEKIKMKLESAPSADLAHRIRKSLGIPDDLDAYLEKIGSPLCKFETYQPVSENLLRETVAQIVKSQVIEQYKKLTGVGFPLVFSTSVVNKGEKQVFWDIVSPTLKFEGLK